MEGEFEQRLKKILEENSKEDVFTTLSHSKTEDVISYSENTAL